jgi:hypothetical protein
METTFGDKSLMWYMMYKEIVLMGQTRYLTKIKRDLLKEFSPNSKSQCITQSQEIEQQKGETVWDYEQRLKILLDRMRFQIYDIQCKEWFILGLLPHIQYLLTQQNVMTQVEAVEISMHLEATS